jgi:shikimate kinase
VRREANLVLCGFMGTGKSALAHTLSRLYRLEAVDTDEYIADQAGMPAGEALRHLGEPRFRELERLAVQRAARLRGAVVATGGGVPLDPDNLAVLSSRGVLFLLEASPDTLYRRLQGDTTRPMLGEGTRAELEARLASRKDAYGRIPERVQVDGRSLEDLAREVYTRFLRLARA